MKTPKKELVFNAIFLLFLLVGIVLTAVGFVTESKRQIYADATVVKHEAVTDESGATHFLVDYKYTLNDKTYYVSKEEAAPPKFREDNGEYEEVRISVGTGALLDRTLSILASSLTILLAVGQIVFCMVKRIRRKSGEGKDKE